MQDEQEDPNIINEPISEALSKRYLAYALSTITARALPDVRDGLKPVQRRILYAMRELKLNPDGAYRKCAKIVGEVMGNYHPHGDAAIYATMVRMAQNFAVRYPLVDGQGNFGNVDGDSAAAMRYTESRMTPAAKLLLEGLEHDAVDFRETYDSLNEEPIVLPAGLPNLLANGATGIAVGMATNIPPHNLAELIDACKLLIRNRNTDTTRLLEVLPGPDFPTGGVIVEPTENILAAYETGRGSFRTRAKWHIEKGSRGSWQIIVTEIPYQVQKSKLIEDLANIIEASKSSLLGDVNDESTEDIRLVLEPRSKLTDPDVLMEVLFRKTDLESRFNLNMNVLDKGTPQVMGLRDVLLAYLDHRRGCLLRRSRFRLDKIDKRLHILEGYLIGYLNIDEVIRIIRTEDAPKTELIERFALSEIQAEAVLNLRLRALRKLEEIEIRQEETNLRREREDLLELLDSEPIQWRRVRDELNAVRAQYGPETEIGRRRSDFETASEIDLTSAIEANRPREPLTVILSKQGWIRTLRGHNQEIDSVKFKDEDSLAHALEIMNHDKLVLMSSDGKTYNIDGNKLPGGRGHGEPVRLMFEIDASADIIAIFALDKTQDRLIASDAGYGFIAPGDTFETNRKAGKSLVTLAGQARLLSCNPVSGDMCATISSERKLLIFPVTELPRMERGKGVKLQNYRGNIKLLDICSFNAKAGLSVTQPSGTNRTFSEWPEWTGRRASAGKTAMKGFPKSGLFSAK